MGINLTIFNSFRKNIEEHVETENGEHYIFYADASDINRFSIVSDLSMSDIIVFKQPVGSKLQVLYTINHLTNRVNDFTFHLDVVISNYFICNKKGELLQTFQGGAITDSTLRRVIHIAEESIKYTLSSLKYIPPGTDIKIWLI